LAVPRRTVIAARVTTNGVMRRSVTPAPTTAPQAAATAMPARAEVPGPDPFRSIQAMTTVTSETRDPTDRSMPPATITTVIPTVAMPTTTVCRAMVTRLSAVANVSGARQAKRA
jgi:hypothetical protein